ncbi:mechanosensitive ion channel protein MscL [Erysipelothrix sp. HDW6C]|nr:mechanosensitive ion channel protein MscL [Erysipelothrix sp. HDW6C]QIK70344.1 mechanosensitive ion channel protein MscL [Erysipelothrix sp. HDW6C]
MIEDFNGFIGIAVLVVIVIGSIFGFTNFNKRLKKQDETDEYYRDLL